jgi:hypothetical protein
MARDGIDRNGQEFAVGFCEPMDNLLKSGNLLSADRGPVSGIKGKHDILPAAIPRQIQLSLVVRGESKIRSKVADLERARITLRRRSYPMDRSEPILVVVAALVEVVVGFFVLKVFVEEIVFAVPFRKLGFRRAAHRTSHWRLIVVVNVSADVTNPLHA